MLPRRASGPAAPASRRAGATACPAGPGPGPSPLPGGLGARRQQRPVLTDEGINPWPPLLKPSPRATPLRLPTEAARGPPAAFPGPASRRRLRSLSPHPAPKPSPSCPRAAGPRAGPASLYLQVAGGARHSGAMEVGGGEGEGDWRKERGPEAAGAGAPPPPPTEPKPRPPPGPPTGRPTRFRFREPPRAPRLTSVPCASPRPAPRRGGRCAHACLRACFAAGGKPRDSGFGFCLASPNRETVVARVWGKMNFFPALARSLRVFLSGSALPSAKAPSCA